MPSPITPAQHSPMRLQSKHITEERRKRTGELGETPRASDGKGGWKQCVFVSHVKHACNGPGLGNALQSLELSLTPKGQNPHYTSSYQEPVSDQEKLASSHKTKTQGSICPCVLCNKLPHLKDDKMSVPVNKVHSPALPRPEIAAPLVPFHITNSFTTSRN